MPATTATIEQFQPAVPSHGPVERALLRLLNYLSVQKYAFVAPTGQTHDLVSRRARAGGEDILRDIFGWSRPFDRGQIDPQLFELISAAGVVEQAAEGLKLTIRASTVDGRLYLHSARTSSRDAVFLGPDSYRYARFLRHALGAGRPFHRALDIGVGAGVGAVTLADICSRAQVTGTDVNADALRLAKVNAEHNDVHVDLVEVSGLPAEPSAFDVIAANPPYIAGAVKRTYRDGGGVLGTGLALDWAREGLARLSPGGRFLLYTGSPIVTGRDLVREELERLGDARGCTLDYDEIDPDVFGGTLRQEAYRNVERIAVVGAVLTAA